MSFSLVNAKTSIITSGNAITVPATTLGNLIIVGCANPDNRNLSTVTDDKGNTYSVDNNLIGSGFGAAIASTIDAFGGVTSITVNLDASSTTVHTDVLEFTGKAAAVLGGATSSGTAASGTALTVTSFVTTSGSLIIATGSSNNRTWTKGANYSKGSIDTGSVNGLTQYRPVSSGVETAPMTIDSSSGWVEVAFEYKPLTLTTSWNNYEFLKSVSAGIISLTEKIR